tara:strand:- start:44 stop:268 length:225 start_codon:yes stop_codon:yes gene_type:complete
MNKVTPIEQQIRLQYQEASNDLIDAQELQEEASQLSQKLTDIENKRRRLIEKAYNRLAKLNMMTSDKWKKKFEK